VSRSWNVREKLNGKAKLEDFKNGGWRTTDGLVKQEVMEC
jgi:hypothetical protein